MRKMMIAVATAFILFTSNVYANSSGNSSALVMFQAPPQGAISIVGSITTQMGVRYYENASEDKLVPSVIYVWDVINQFENGNKVYWQVELTQNGKNIIYSYSGTVRFVYLEYGVYVYIDYDWVSNQ